MRAKTYIAAHLKAEISNIAGAQVWLEHRVEIAPDGWRIADVALLVHGRLREVHECQISLLPDELIHARTDDYASIGAACYWWLGSTGTNSTEIRNTIRESYGGFYELVPELSDQQ